MSTRTVASTMAQNHFGQILDDVTQNNTRYVIRRRGVSQAIVLSLSDFESLLVNAQERAKVEKIVRELRPAYGWGETVSQE